MIAAIQVWWRSFCAALPMRVALAGVTAVWGVGCVWSFAEQRAFAAAKHFTIPELLPLGLDGFAAAMAGVAYAASLDGRPAVGARLGTATAVALSAGSNGVWADQRSSADPATIALAVVVPVIANVAFEVLLGEMRRRVQRRRGLPAPIAVPMPRVIRLVLAPRSTFASWRRHVLDVTSVRAAAMPEPDLAHRPGPPADWTRPSPDPVVPASASGGANGQVHGTLYPEHVPAVPAGPPAGGPVDPPTIPIPPLWLLPELHAEASVPAAEDDVRDDRATVEGEQEQPYGWLIEALREQDVAASGGERKRPTVRSVRAEFGVSTDTAGWALREARACAVAATSA